MLLKKILSIVWLALLLLNVALERPAAAGPSADQLFQTNCAVCHALGTNRVVADKTLKKEALQQYDMYSKDAIVNQITYGKNAMPRFKGRLTPQQIETVAAYVLDRAEQGWSK